MMISDGSQTLMIVAIALLAYFVIQSHMCAPPAPTSSQCSAKRASVEESTVSAKVAAGEEDDYSLKPKAHIDHTIGGMRAESVWEEHPLSSDFHEQFQHVTVPSKGTPPKKSLILESPSVNYSKHLGTSVMVAGRSCEDEVFKPPVSGLMFNMTEAYAQEMEKKTE